MIDDLLNYRARAQQAAKERAGEAIYVSGVDEAQVILETMLRSSRDRIDVFYSSMHERIFDDQFTIEVAHKFLHLPRRKMRVLLSDGRSLAKREFYRVLKDSPNLTFGTLPEMVSGGVSGHFAVMDGDSFLYHPKATSLAGAAFFGKKTEANRFDGTFKSLWDRANFPFSQPTLNLQTA